MEIKNLKKKPEEITVVFVQAILMPNDEIISDGKSLGFNHKLKYLFVKA